MDRLDPKAAGRSVDIVEQNAAQLKRLFPELFTDGKFDFEALRSALGSYADERQERFGLSWSGKSRARQIAQTPSTGTLRPCPQESVNWETTQHLFLEGDNLEILKLLQKSYHKRVKLIYIDPPYNTGKEFIYPDKYQEPLQTYLRYTGQLDDAGFRLSANTEASGRYHTNWLNMIYPRLKLARNLLADDGVLFISIDDHEVHHLRSVCDEIFGEENRVAQIVAMLNPRGRHLDRFVATAHEYVLVYARNMDEPGTMAMLPKAGRMVAEYRKEDGQGKYRELELRNRNSAFNKTTRPNLYYPLYVNPADGSVAVLPSRTHSVEVWPRNSEGGESCWTWGKPKAARTAELLVGRQVGNGGWRVYRKDYLVQDGQVTGTLPKSVWTEAEFNNDYGRRAIQALLGENAMDFPKSPDFIRRIVQLGAGEDGIVLDFFAGSCTTAEAVLQANAEDGGSRRFMMVQLPEPCDERSPAYRAGYRTIAEIGKERIRRVLAAAVESAGAVRGRAEGDVDVPAAGGGEDLGFRVFKLDTSNIKAWEAGSDNLELSLRDGLESIKPGRTDADVLCELLLTYGLDLASPVAVRQIHGSTVSIVGDGALIVCLSDGIDLDVAAGIARLKAELRPVTMRVVFRDAGFRNDGIKTNTVQILRQAGVDDVKSL